MLLFLLLLSTHSVVASPSTFSAAAAPRPHRPPTGAAAPTLTSLGSCTERPRASTAAAAAAHSPAPCRSTAQIAVSFAVTFAGQIHSLILFNACQHQVRWDREASLTHMDRISAWARGYVPELTPRADDPDIPDPRA